MRKVHRPNSTIRLNKSLIRITASDGDCQLSFKKLNEAKLPSESLIIVIAEGPEAYQERHEVGTVKELIENRQPFRFAISTEIAIRKINFRIIVRNSNDYKLIASCERLKVIEKDLEEHQILKIRYVPDLGELFWKVELSNDEQTYPILLLNNSPELDFHLKITNRLPYLRGLIIPAALREILTFLANNSEYNEENGWQSEWKTWLRMTFDVEIPEKDSGNLSQELDLAVQTIVTEYFKFLSQFKKNRDE